jgi:hypothetical protein
MSPSVRLFCYPDGDGRFSEHTALTLRIDLPDHYAPADVLRDIERRLRDTYPLATILVEEGSGIDKPTWHVHRDGARFVNQPRTAGLD